VALQNFRVEAGKYDMIILDIKMPEMNGFELYRQIKKIDNRVKICFLTASEMSYGEYEDIFSRLDESCFIQKPIENEELIARLNKIIIT
jgi:DNA-binding response OmpR family regulator